MRKNAAENSLEHWVEAPLQNKIYALTNNIESPWQRHTTIGGSFLHFT